MLCAVVLRECCLVGVCVYVMCVRCRPLCVFVVRLSMLLLIVVDVLVLCCGVVHALWHVRACVCVCRVVVMFVWCVGCCVVCHVCIAVRRYLCVFVRSMFVLGSFVVCVVLCLCCGCCCVVVCALLLFVFSSPIMIRSLFACVVVCVSCVWVSFFVGDVC